MTAVETRPLSEVEIAAYRRDGYLVPDFCLPEATVARMRAAFADLEAANAHLTTDFILCPHLPDPAVQKVATDKWVHVVLTDDGSVARTYVDGRLDKEQLPPNEIGISDTPLHISLQGDGNWRYEFTSSLDDVLIWNRALTEFKVLGLWATQQRAINTQGASCEARNSNTETDSKRRIPE